jgi:pimeloyl-ACP methyl ester carboxylesterase
METIFVRSLIGTASYHGPAGLGAPLGRCAARVMQRCRARLLGAVSLLLGLTAGCSTARSEAPDYARTPVLFVHGHGMSSADWRPLIRYLVDSGYPREYLYAVDIVPNTMANVPAAQSVIAPAAAALLVRANAAAQSAGHRGEVPQQLDIVSHSMGAVSSRWYAAKLHPELARTWISLAGANHGSNALCGFTHEAAREMCPAFATDAKTHALQAALNGTEGAWVDETPYGLGIDRPGAPGVPPDGTRRILYLTVRIEPDHWIQPERSAILDGAGGVPIAVPDGVPVQEASAGNFLFLARVGHDPLVKHRDLIRLVAAMLAARDRAAGDHALPGSPAVERQGSSAGRR